MGFKKATKEQAKLRAALIGPPGGGKTYSALKIASFLGGKIAFIDTERGSASKYADKFNFDVHELTSFSPDEYIKAIKEACSAGYDVLIIDSLSHAWSGKDGILEQVDQETLKSKSGNAYTSGWRKATPKHNLLIDTILQANIHIILTMRVKTEYVMEEINGKKSPKKIGLAPVQRDGLEYEFDIVGDIDQDHNLIITKTRCEELTDKIFNKPGEEVGLIIKNWLTTGAAPINRAESKNQQQPQSTNKPATINITVSELLNTFKSIAYPPDFLQGYERYLYKKYSNTIQELTEAQLTEQSKILAVVKANQDKYNEFGGILQSYLTELEPEQQVE